MDIVHLCSKSNGAPIIPVMAQLVMAQLGFVSRFFNGAPDAAASVAPQCHAPQHGPCCLVSCPIQKPNSPAAIPAAAAVMQLRCPC